MTKPNDLILRELSALFEQEGRELFSRLFRKNPIDPRLHQLATSAKQRLGRIASLIANQHRATSLREVRLNSDWSNFLTLLEQLCLTRDLERRNATLLGYIQCCFSANRHEAVIETLKPRECDLDGSLTRALGQAYARRGQSLVRQSRFLDAVDTYRLSLMLEGPRAEVLSNLGGAYLLSGELDAAENCFRQAIGHDPKLLAARSSLLLSLHYSSKHLAVEIAREHREQGWAWTRRARKAPAIIGRRGAGALRVGYVSSDFRNHPVARMIEPILKHHDRENFQIFCYYTAPIVDQITRRFARLGHHWRCVHSLDDDSIAEKIRRDQCDILIDLNGHTHGNRLGVFARRPAPVQATYLGYPDTTGLAAMQYRITDAICDPRGTAQLCKEKLVRIEGCFLCYQPNIDRRLIRSESERIDDGFCFGSLNQLPKLSDRTIELWARILRAVPESKLLLKSLSLTDSRVVMSVLARFESAGISADRLILRGYFSSELQHLETYHDIDLALDCFPYNGATTTCESLWMGCPVLTLRGNTHVSRVGTSLLHAVALDEFVAESEEVYLRKAVAIAHDKKRLREISVALRSRIQQSMLCNQRNFVFRFEQMLEGMWARSNA